MSLGFVCKCVSAKNVGSSLYLDLKKGFVVAASFGVRLSRIHKMNASQTNPKGRLRGGYD